MFALRKWPETGVPPSPAGWIITTARNRAIDRLRRESSRDDRHAEAALLQTPDEPMEVGPVDDDRFRLIFTCCHPALAPAAQVALTLRLIAGLQTPEIARSFLVPEPPWPSAWCGPRTRSGPPTSLTASRATPSFPTACGRCSRCSTWVQRGLRGDCGRRPGAGRAVRGGDPPGPTAGRPHARRARGAGAAGPAAAHRVPPAGPDRAPTARSCGWPTRTGRRWDRDLIAEGHRWFAPACAATCPGRTRSRPPSPPSTATRRPRPTPTGRRSCACTTSCWRRAHARRGPQPGIALAELDGPAVPSPRRRAGDLDGYYLFHATRADLLERLGRPAEALAAYDAALYRSTNAAERRLLERAGTRSPGAPEGKAGRRACKRVTRGRDREGPASSRWCAATGAQGGLSSPRPRPRSPAKEFPEVVRRRPVAGFVPARDGRGAAGSPVPADGDGDRRRSGRPDRPTSLPFGRPSRTPPPPRRTRGPGWQRFTRPRSENRARPKKSGPRRRRPILSSAPGRVSSAAGDRNRLVVLDTVKIRASRYALSPGNPNRHRRTLKTATVTASVASARLARSPTPTPASRR